LFKKKLYIFFVREGIYMKKIRYVKIILGKISVGKKKDL